LTGNECELCQVAGFHMNVIELWGALAIELAASKEPESSFVALIAICVCVFVPAS
jgi:hypothetical protein